MKITEKDEFSNLFLEISFLGEVTDICDKLKYVINIFSFHWFI